MSIPSTRNPFRTIPATPNATGTGLEANQGSTTGQLETRTEVTSPTPLYDGRDPTGMSFLEEPPPYTPNPSYVSGETTVELGPARPFQPPPPRPGSTPNGQWSRVQDSITNHRTGTSTLPYSRPTGGSRTGSMFQQLANSLNDVVNQLTHPPTNSQGTSNISTHATGQSGWSSYPGHAQQQNQQSFAPPPVPPPGNGLHASPPRHPLSASVSSSALQPHITPSSRPTQRRHSSEFARDFYAAGAAEELQRSRTPPPLPSRNSTSNSIHATADDGRPTTQPVAGHPFLNEGKVLVYPRGHECEKCRNVGYKNADPSRPCTRCWSKYAKHFSGPLAYSFSPSSTATNFQRPLPRLPPPASPPPPLPAFHSPPGSFPPPNHGSAFFPPQRGFPSPLVRPPPGAIVYTAGDPRIGGRLCWKCNGKGNVSFMILDRITCEACGGIGRIMNN